METEKREYHLSNNELKQIQDMAHLLWLGDGALQTYKPYKDKHNQSKKKRILTEEEKELFFKMNHDDGLPVGKIAKIFNLCSETISRYIRQKKHKLGIPIARNGKK